MTYEEYLDEVTTLIVEKYGVTEKAAIKIVVDAQDKEYFVAHDDNRAMRTIDRAHDDARTLFKASAPAGGAAAAPKRPRK
ncbi:hypothetical protein [Massilia sp. YIM B02443]|jgi:hypothetical protein|uniref:hypothetical protein n=1 Tax=Massilia sp. YIM B02443 TaxID=3050127 RepID=UPI0025B69F47|nr:hypothetical protein [Massilia sp. YIM B02443]MDN4039282.1 hypothetical protein [Massilia sp. YIM B02443]